MPLERLRVEKVVAGRKDCRHGPVGAAAATPRDRSPSYIQSTAWRRVRHLFSARRAEGAGRGEGLALAVWPEDGGGGCPPADGPGGEPETQDDGVNEKLRRKESSSISLVTDIVPAGVWKSPVIWLEKAW